MGKPAKTYPESMVDQLGSSLDSLARNPKGLQTKQLVQRMQPKIEAAQAAGYTLDDIVNVFKAQGVDLTLNTLKQYLRESRSLNSDPNATKPAASDPKPARAKKTKSSTPSLQQLPESDRPLPLEAEVEVKPRLTNTNQDGFQEMLNDDEL